MRHTAASILLSRGVHVELVSAMLGHSTIVLTLDTHSHVIPVMHADAAAAMDSVFTAPKCVPDKRNHLPGKAQRSRRPAAERIAWALRGLRAWSGAARRRIVVAGNRHRAGRAGRRGGATTWQARRRGRWWWS